MTIRDGDIISNEEFDALRNDDGEPICPYCEEHDPNLKEPYMNEEVYDEAYECEYCGSGFERVDADRWMFALNSDIADREYNDEPDAYGDMPDCCIICEYKDDKPKCEDACDRIAHE
jgi:hypothetical protein